MGNATETPEGVDVYTDDGSWHQARVCGINVVGSGPSAKEAMRRLRWALESIVQSDNLTPEQTALVEKVLPQLPKNEQ